MRLAHRGVEKKRNAMKWHGKWETVHSKGKQRNETTKGMLRYMRNGTGYDRNRQMKPRTEQLALQRGTRNDADADAADEAKRQKSDETLKWQKASGPTCAGRVGCPAI